MNSISNWISIRLKDVDECSAQESPCPVECINSPGSFTCLCPAGYNFIDNICKGKNQFSILFSNFKLKILIELKISTSAWWKPTPIPAASHRNVSTTKDRSTANATPVTSSKAKIVKVFNSIEIEVKSIKKTNLKWILKISTNVLRINATAPASICPAPTSAFVIPDTNYVTDDVKVQMIPNFPISLELIENWIEYWKISTNAPITSAADGAWTCPEVTSASATRATNWKATSASISTNVKWTAARGSRGVRAPVSTCRERTGANVPRDSRANDTIASILTSAARRAMADVLTSAPIPTDHSIATAVPDTKSVNGNSISLNF